MQQQIAALSSKQQQAANQQDRCNAGAFRKLPDDSKTRCADGHTAENGDAADTQEGGKATVDPLPSLALGRENTTNAA